MDLVDNPTESAGVFARNELLASFTRVDFPTRLGPRYVVPFEAAANG